MSGDSVKVNDALEVFGETDIGGGGGRGNTRQAHVRIGSRTASSGATRADEAGDLLRTSTPPTLNLLLLLLPLPMLRASI